MKKNFFFILLCACTQLFQTSFAQSVSPAILWQRTLGGTNAEVLTGMCIGTDKSMAMCGYSNSGAAGNKSSASYGGNDYWVVKLSDNGTLLWNKTFGGSNEDLASAIISTSDGGYLVGGSSMSDKSGSKTLNSFASSDDYWVLKLDANGNVQWDKTLGGTYRERLTSLAQLPNGNFLIGGNSYSNASGTKKTDARGSWTKSDYWTVILNSSGTEVSQQLFGGNGDDLLTCVAPVGTAGFYAAGYSYSQKGNGKTLRPLGNNDYYIIRSSSKGTVELEGDYGSKLSDYLTCIQVLQDSSLILGGYSNSSRGSTKSDNFYGVSDFWLLKLTKDGIKQWDKTIAGGAGDGFGGDYMVSVQQTKDKGFILGGYSDANIGRNKTENSKGGYDYWVVKTDSVGNVQWDKTIGGSGDDKLTAVYELDSNRYIVAGTSVSAQSGDKTSGIVGDDNASDYWIMVLSGAQPIAKVAPAPAAKSSNTAHGYNLEVMPNPVKDVLNIKYNTAANSKVDLVIYTASGKTVLQAALTASVTESMRSFSIANLPAGSYFAVMYVNGVKLTKAFTKE